MWYPKIAPLLFIFAHVQGQQFPPLQSYNVDPTSITISGISSGGAFATQVHFSYSSQIIGAGIFEAAAYPCALVEEEFLNCLGTPYKTNISNLIRAAASLADQGLIDPLTNMNDSKVYVYHGMNDSVVPFLSSGNVVDMYKRLGAEVHAQLSINAGHGQPVDGNGFGGPCGEHNADYFYINECGYNAAYEMLNFFYGENLTRPEKGYQPDGLIVDFNQLEFSVYDPIVISMSPKGYLYVPKNCQNGTTKMCRFHIAFHGCNSNEFLGGYAAAYKTHYAEVAELNDIIILFPQSAITVINTAGCWDFAGLSGVPDYATKRGKQVSAVGRMMSRILGENR